MQRGRCSRRHRHCPPDGQQAAQAAGPARAAARAADRPFAPPPRLAGRGVAVGRSRSAAACAGARPARRACAGARCRRDLAPSIPFSRRRPRPGVARALERAAAAGAVQRRRRDLARRHGTRGGSRLRLRRARHAQFKRRLILSLVQQGHLVLVAQRALATICESRRVKWSFQVVRGEVAHEVVAAAGAISRKSSARTSPPKKPAPFDEGALLPAAGYILTSLKPELGERLRENGRRWVEEHYNWRTVYARWDEVYERLL